MPSDNNNPDSATLAALGADVRNLTSAVGDLSSIVREELHDIRKDLQTSQLSAKDELTDSVDTLRREIKTDYVSHSEFHPIERAFYLVSRSIIGALVVSILGAASYFVSHLK